MLNYACKICDMFRLNNNCKNCPLNVLCHKRVPITRKAINTHELITEFKAKEIYREIIKNEDIKKLAASIDNNIISARPKHYKRKRGPKPKPRL